MSDSNIAIKERAAATAVEDWVSRCLVDSSDWSTSDRVSKFGSERIEATIGEDFISRLNARFSDLDLAPRNGLVSIFEIERAIANPLLHFDEKDIQMLKLLRKYYTILCELNDAERDALDAGISRADVSVLANCISKSVHKLRERLEEEYRASH